MPTNLVFLTGSIAQIDNKANSAAPQRLNFTLSTVESWVNRVTGQQYEHHETINCAVRDRNSLMGGNDLAIGTELMVEGKLRTRRWIDKKTASPRAVTEVAVVKVHILQKQSTPVIEEAQVESDADADIDVQAVNAPAGAMVQEPAAAMH